MVKASNRIGGRNPFDLSSDFDYSSNVHICIRSLSSFIFPDTVYGFYANSLYAKYLSGKNIYPLD